MDLPTAENDAITVRSTTVGESKKHKVSKNLDLHD